MGDNLPTIDEILSAKKKLQHQKKMDPSRIHIVDDFFNHPAFIHPIKPTGY
jgi:hypothetical protein